MTKRYEADRTPENKLLADMALNNVYHAFKGLIERILHWLVFNNTTQHNGGNDND